MTDDEREAKIADTQTEIERQVALAKSEACLVRRGAHRDEARRLASEVAQLVAGRSPDVVLRLELARGLA